MFASSIKTHIELTPNVVDSQILILHELICNFLTYSLISAFVESRDLHLGI